MTESFEFSVKIQRALFVRRKIVLLGSTLTCEFCTTKSDDYQTPLPQETKSSAPEQQRQTENSYKIEITYFNLRSLKKKTKKNHRKEISRSSHKSRLINGKFTPYHEYVTTSVPTWLEIFDWNAIIMSHKRMLKPLYKLAHSSASVGVF